MSEIRVWKIVPLSMVTTSEQERAKWIAAGHEVVEFVSIERIAQLETELAKARKDQARYQWLKSIDAAKWISLHQLCYEQLDAHIDAAIKEQVE